MPSKVVIIGVLICVVAVILSTVLGVYYTNVSCPSFGSDCSTGATAAPAPVGAPSPAAPATARAAPVPPPPAGTPSAVAAAPLAKPPPPPPPPPSAVGPTVIGMAHQFGRVGTVTNPPALWFATRGSCNVTVRVRGTTLTMPVISGVYTNGDVYVQLGAPYTGTLILEKTDGTQLASQTVTNATSVVFGGAAHS